MTIADPRRVHIIGNAIALLAAEHGATPGNRFSAAEITAVFNPYFPAAGRLMVGRYLTRHLDDINAWLAPHGLRVAEYRPCVESGHRCALVVAAD